MSTRLKVVEFLSPSASEICMICYQDLQKKYDGKASAHGHKILLWKGSTKTEACIAVEEFLGYSVDRCKDLKCICRPCLNHITKGKTILDKNKNRLLTAKEKATDTYLRSRVKREAESPAGEKFPMQLSRPSKKTRRPILQSLSTSENPTDLSSDTLTDGIKPLQNSKKVKYELQIYVKIVMMSVRNIFELHALYLTASSFFFTDIFGL